MTVEYDSVYTVGNKQFWSRTAVDGWTVLWKEMWCFECDGWQVVEYFMGERECTTCNAWSDWRKLVEGEMSDAFENYEQKWEDAHPLSRPFGPVTCRGCARAGEHYQDEPWRCPLCEGVVQESDATIGRV